jgi:hypothetical protein
VGVERERVAAARGPGFPVNELSVLMGCVECKNDTGWFWLFAHYLITQWWRCGGKLVPPPALPTIPPAIGPILMRDWIGK